MLKHGRPEIANLAFTILPPPGALKANLPEIYA
jgi:hypothetical protein